MGSCLKEGTFPAPEARAAAHTATFSWGWYDGETQAQHAFHGSAQWLGLSLCDSGIPRA